LVRVQVSKNPKPLTTLSIIATLTAGRTMASNETEAQKLMHHLDADYALVIFGGVSGYQSDDINKFLWMVSVG